MRTLNENGPFICDKCGSKHPNRDSFMKHNYWNHRSATFFCDLCPRSFTQKYILASHFKKDHLKLRPFECKICGHKTFLAAYHRAHLLRHNSKSECNVCHKLVTNMSGHLRNHVRVKCVICSKIYSKNSINQHVKTHATKGN